MAVAASRCKSLPPRPSSTLVSSVYVSVPYRLLPPLRAVRVHSLTHGISARADSPRLYVPQLGQLAVESLLGRSVGQGPAGQLDLLQEDTAQVQHSCCHSGLHTPDQGALLRSLLWPVRAAKQQPCTLTHLVLPSSTRRSRPCRCSTTIARGTTCRSASR